MSRHAAKAITALSCTPQGTGIWHGAVSAGDHQPLTCRISGSDIKDKAALVEARKDVERQMERFKVCEKETKTKAFSKEGLGQAAKLDPREKARTDLQKWLKDAVESLNGQVSTGCVGTVKMELPWFRDAAQSLIARQALTGSLAQRRERSEAHCMAVLKDVVVTGFRPST